MDNIFLAILPLIGIVVGAALQFRLGRRSEHQKQQDNLRSQAYVDYLKALAASAHLRSDEELRDVYRDGADAKARIAVYGSAEVIRALVHFERVGAAVRSGPSADALATVVSKMRSKVDDVSVQDLRVLLVGPEEAEQKAVGLPERARIA